MTQLKIVDYPVSKLEEMANPDNPRWMPDDQMDALKASLGEFGIVEPIIVNTRTQQVVGGHQRIKAAGVNGVEVLPCVEIDVEPAKETALNLALNKIRGDWDYEKLAAMLAEMDADALALTGFSDTEAQSIVEGFTLDEEGIVDDEDDGIQRDIRNRSDEEVAEQFESTEKVQFGMFSKAVPVAVYVKWIEGLKKESELGESPIALGAAIAKRLGIDVSSVEVGAEAGDGDGADFEDFVDDLPFTDDEEFDAGEEVEVNVEDEEGV